LIASLDVCGFFFRDTPDYQPSLELTEFIRSGSTPIYIGFGSIVIENAAEMTQVLIEAVRLSNVRAIISRGWSMLGGPSNTDNIFYLDDCPHGN
jgi:UDP:flavonoid glycosyltransferase YjiC (YdhE family)